MKMCEKCWNRDCDSCGEMMGYINYYLAELQLETGIGYYDLLDAVEGWYNIKVDDWNKYKVDALKIVRERIKEGKI